MNVKRFLNVLLTITMFVGLLSGFALTASAAETSGTTGSCTWTFDDTTGILTICGNGYMGSSNTDDQPWVEYKTQITKVVIEDGVKSVGGNAFYGFTKIQEVIIPSSVKYIYSGAFQGTYFKSITIPEGVTEIGPNAFRNSNITSIVIPASVTKIGGSAFQNAYRLVTVEILGNLTEIGGYAFYTCGQLESITIHGNVDKVGNNVFYRSGSKAFTLYYWGTTEPTYGTNLFQSYGASREVSHAYPGTSFLGYGLKRTQQSYTVTVTDSENGTVSADATDYKIGETVTLTVTPATGLVVNTVKYNNGTKDTEIIAVGGEYAFTMPAYDVTVSATFCKPAEITLTTSNVTIENLYKSAVLIVASYNGSTLVDVKTVSVSADCETAIASTGISTTGVNTIKAFLWKDISGIEPLCESKSVAYSGNTDAFDGEEVPIG